MSIIIAVAILVVCLLIFSIFIDAVAATPVLNIIAGVLLIILTGLYLLPTGIHIMRGLPNASTKFWINFLLGWTIIVWIWGLVTACITENRNSTLNEQ